ncbi:hypothetical protein ES319_1Z111500v1 [Gossypium barbadense]|uniref:Uncharacterized protein n=2 Tax=Gossypium TaxID=3633 RepID=A0A5J5NA23_GOSBA|nr:hypothetical protein ES319_1Z111500v1 [Gossypium barbadense]TYH10906.1 hypothetical protein ES288_A07G215200v1 [Gossypium darwinii]
MTKESPPTTKTTGDYGVREVPGDGSWLARRRGGTRGGQWLAKSSAVAFLGGWLLLFSFLCNGLGFHLGCWVR